MHHVTDTVVYDEAGGSVGGWRVRGEAGGWRMAAALQTVEAAASGAADSRRGQRERGRERTLVAGGRHSGPSCCGGCTL